MICWVRSRSVLARQGGAAAAGGDWRIAVLLAAALATVFLFSGYDRGEFYRNTEHDNMTDVQLAAATNLSSEHGFAQFRRRYVGLDGELTYKGYHRFPPVGYVLIKLVTAPFPNDLSARIYAARMLMLAFFAGAAVLAYLSLRRLAGGRAVAVTATLLAFSSYPLLYYSDMVATEGVMDLFAVMLAFHGVAVYSQRRAGAPASAGNVLSDGLQGQGGPPCNGGVGQLCAKACAAVLLGWHVYGLLLPLLLVALPCAVRARDWRGFRHYMLLGAGAVLAGVAMLAFNFAREYHIYGGSRPFLDLPSVQSMLNRTGVSPSREFVGWQALFQDQFRRLGEATLPWTLAEPLQGHVRGWHWVGGACMTVALLAICLPGTRHRIAWTALALCGMGWALPMRHQVPPHEFEVLFHVGTPLAAYALALTRLRNCAALRRADRPVQGAMAAAAGALFVVSSWLMSRVGDDSETRRWERAILADVQVIRRYTQGKVVHVPKSLLETNPCCRLVYLTGSDIARRPKPHADFVVASDMPRFAAWRSPLANSPASRSLTPHNRVVFLYEPDTYLVALNAIRGVYEHHARTSARPAMESRFDVHRLGDTLLYVGERKHCSRDNRTRFFLHVFAADVNDLPTGQRRLGYANLDRSFQPFVFWARDARCFAVRFLPSFPITAIRTGQYDKRKGSRLWEGGFPFSSGRSNDGEDSVAVEYERIASRQPLARSVWSVHLLRGAGGDKLAFLKTSCTLNDVAGRFLLHVVPVDTDDLPADRSRFDNWDFDFIERGGALFDGKCMVKVSLPGYPIASVRTGQHAPVAGELWSAEFRMPRVGAGM